MKHSCVLFVLYNTACLHLHNLSKVLIHLLIQWIFILEINTKDTEGTRMELQSKTKKC